MNNYYLEVRPNNCFCHEICGECKQWFDCTEEVVYYKVIDEERVLICPACFPQLLEKMRGMVLESLFGLK